jgi:hypothetical protein
MVYNKRMAEIAEPYNIAYNKDFEAWQRMLGIGGKKKFELGKITEKIVGENIMINKLNYVRYDDHDLVLKESDDGVLVCICGEDTCHSLSKLYHKGSGTAFLVGSKCITLAEGQEDYINLKKCAKKNGLCDECKEPIVFKGKNKNSTKKNFVSSCDNCINIKKQELLEKLKKENEEARIRVAKLIAEREEYEIIKKDPKNKHLLNISYANKDKYKEYCTGFDFKIKKWYWIGLIHKIPDEIKEFLIKDIH